MIIKEGHFHIKVQKNNKKITTNLKTVSRWRKETFTTIPNPQECFSIMNCGHADCQCNDMNHLSTAEKALMMKLS